MQAGSVPVHLVVDSTGLKIFGEGEWLAQKHKIKGNTPPLAQTPPRTGPGQRCDCLRQSDSRVTLETALHYPGSWINSMPRSRAFWLTAPMMERLHEIC